MSKMELWPMVPPIPYDIKLDLQARQGEGWAMVHNNNCIISRIERSARYDWSIPAPPIKARVEAQSRKRKVALLVQKAGTAPSGNRSS